MEKERTITLRFGKCHSVEGNRHLSFPRRCEGGNEFSSGIVGDDEEAGVLQSHSALCAVRFEVLEVERVVGPSRERSEMVHYVFCINKEYRTRSLSRRRDCCECCSCQVCVDVVDQLFGCERGEKEGVVAK